jgi:hypothetical protein
MALNEDIVARLTEIENAVKNNQSVDWEQVRADFETTHKQYIDSQIQEKLDSRPMRRVPGALIGADGTKITPSNRYHKHLAAFEKDGCYTWGTSKILPIDLWLAVKVIDQAKAFFPEKVKADVSGDLRAAVKALTATGAGTGDEYVPTGMDAGLWEDMFLSARVLGSSDDHRHAERPVRSAGGHRRCDVAQGYPERGHHRHLIRPRPRAR